MDDVKLIAFDEKDLEIISSLTQDAIIVPNEMSFDNAANHFIIPMRRYAWENDKKEPTRKSAVMRFLNVRKVQSKAVEFVDDQPPLSLLSINASPMDESTLVSLTFAHKAHIVLWVDALELELCDLGSSWSASRQPNHGK